MKRIFGTIALLAASAAVMAVPALANQRTDYNYGDTCAPYVSTVRVRDRHVADRGHDRDAVRYRSYDRR